MGPSNWLGRWWTLAAFRKLKYQFETRWSALTVLVKTCKGKRTERIYCSTRLLNLWQMLSLLKNSCGWSLLPRCGRIYRSCGEELDNKIIELIETGQIRRLYFKKRTKSKAWKKNENFCRYWLGGIDSIATEARQKFKLINPGNNWVKA